MTRVANYCAICGEPLIHKEYEGRERPYCTSCQTPIYFDPKVAVVIFIEHCEKVLLIKRKGDPGKGKWALPAGFVDYDESPEDAAVRETLEETNLHVELDKLLAVFPKKDDGLADIVIAYSAIIQHGKPRAGDDAAEVDWFTRDNLPELVFYPSITLTTLWKNRKLIP